MIGKYRDLQLYAVGIHINCAILISTIRLEHMLIFSIFYELQDFHQVKAVNIFKQLYKNIIPLLKKGHLFSQPLIKILIFSILEQQQAISMRLRVLTNRYFSSIDDFSFIKQIGVGSFGSVKLALHLQTNKCYAVKIVDIGSGFSENQGLLLEREINLHSNIDHPHIIKLWDTLIEDSKVYMIMELAQSGTLFTYQNKHRNISQGDAYKFFSQTLSAIRYMHSKDLMHRDIKPQNILLDNAFNVRICDLGWATDNILMKRKTFCGTYEYMAPEMLFQKEYNFSIDVWALGILLYELLHNYAPFPGKNLEQMKQIVKLGEYELGCNFSKQLKNLIIQILQFDPDQRPSITKIMSHPWMQRMKRQTKAQIGKIQSELKGEISNRAKVQRDKMSLMNTKKHKRFDSLMNENLLTKQNQHPLTNQLVHPIERFVVDDKKRLKKKCKTQGEQSMQKLFTEGGQTIETNKITWKRQKQNNQSKLTTQLSKTGLTFKGQGTLSSLKMKRIAQKLSELTNKYPQDKKKARLKPQRQQLS